MVETPRTDFMVLRLTPYQDNAVVVTGISPEMGRMGFFVRNSNPMRGLIDLFQIVNLGYRRGQGELYYPSDIEFSVDYGRVSQNVDSYNGACALALFALEHCQENTAMPAFFLAMQVALIRLCSGKLPVDALLTGIGLTFLNEGGWLAPAQMAPREAAQCELLLRMAAGGDIPALTEDNWGALRQWVQACIERAEN